MTLTPDSIDWTHVAPQYKWMARDHSGLAFLFSEKPNLSHSFWKLGIFDDVPLAKVLGFASYRRGTCDWRDSLVQRPEGG